MRILIVEDDAALARGLTTSLRLLGYAVDHAADGLLGAELALHETYNLIVLDVELPGQSGFEVVRALRRRAVAVPVLMLTGRHALSDRVKGLDLGADDYLVKPFELAEFEARVRALVRRGLGSPAPRLVCGGLVYDREHGDVALNGRPLRLRKRELAVLEGLMSRAGRLVPRERLAAEVFGLDDEVSPNALEVHLARLRRHLEPDGPRIVTVRGLGYLIEAPSGAADR
jgi:DNA-binding response OmpR family regulator